MFQVSKSIDLQDNVHVIIMINLLVILIFDFESAQRSVTALGHSYIPTCNSIILSMTALHALI